MAEMSADNRVLLNFLSLLNTHGNPVALAQTFGGGSSTNCHENEKMCCLTDEQNEK